ncbi:MULTISPECIES: hypothetical protein [Arthrobacter]|uniref:Uncharacterized protein n=1 Tax=Arthrobacter terricola TaxID=2547396 RepID=A0A4R5KU27_9MICC|nr:MULTISPECIES: hypothetical protein [Arthrobacter]MBT8159930.1 hypothetical protein [Arthrobacter sp. GN70]TDF98992.1 hypothetical protein E1809_05260 [Arthrobacter terricola]
MQDLLKSLGFSPDPEKVNWFLIFGRLLTALIIAVGILWAPQRTALNTFGIPLSIPDAVSIMAALQAIGLLFARRRFRRAHRCWQTVSAPLEAGMRAGLVLTDLGFAGMLILQNLRWHEGGNLFAVGALVISSFLLVAPQKTNAIRTYVLLVVVSSAGTLLFLIGNTLWFDGHDPLGSGPASTLFVILAGTVLITVSTPALYRVTAHPRALRSRGVLVDLSIKAASIFILASLVLLTAEVTPWPRTAPFIAVAVFFSGLVVFRSSLTRITSPETFGLALFLVRLKPSWVKPIIFRSVVTAMVVVTPLTFVLCAFLLLKNYTHVVVLLGALVAVEIGVDALIIQRRTAVLPASHISKLPQKSKAGFGAALCAGFAVVLSGILGTVTQQAIQIPWLPLAAGGMALVAILLTSLVIKDAPQWLGELSATETEDT